jgi:hypothetical protein
MSAGRDDSFRKLERALAETHRLTDERTSQLDVVDRTMRSIRRTAVETDSRATANMLDELVWRTATIAAAVVLVATMLVVGVLHRSPLEHAGLLAEEFDSAPLFGE